MYPNRFPRCRPDAVRSQDCRDYDLLIASGSLTSSGPAPSAVPPCCGTVAVVPAVSGSLSIADGVVEGASALLSFKGSVTVDGRGATSASGLLDLFSDVVGRRVNLTFLSACSDILVSSFTKD